MPVQEKAILCHFNNSVHETMNDYMNSAENWSLAIEIGSKVLTSHCTPSTMKELLNFI